MNTKQLADLLNVTPNTVRRWTKEYRDHLSPSATPVKGRQRNYTPHDQQVIHYVATMRQSGAEPDDIADRLEYLRAADWAGLPALPPEWGDPPNLIPAPLAAARASDLAMLAVLQAELEHARSELLVTREAVEALRAELGTSEAARAELVTERGKLEVQIARLEGQVSTLEARLGAYASLTGGRPLNLLLIIGAAVLLTALIVMVIALVTFYA